MIYESSLREALVVLAEQCKTQYLGISLLIDEVAALRETVRGLDSTFSEVLEQKRKEASSDEIRKAATEQLNDLIRRLKSGEVC